MSGRAAIVERGEQRKKKGGAGVPEWATPQGGDGRFERCRWRRQRLGYAFIFDRDRAIATGCGRGGKGSNVRSGECSNSGSKSWPRVEWREERGRRHCREGRGGKQRGRSRVRDRREEGETEAGAGKATMGRFHAADERNEKERKSGGRGEIKPIDGRWRGRRPGRWLVLGELR
ncbi:hypothetical protein C4D60_Mb03t07280 [Musa balbisiana]|uniref:Uncharacterized protein n=1 Tax=Musa balbisiana TaxID=52838 RepID=A0A4S8JAL5_MUSBA|nr:hypothetical protein C4D60_Mb03t07280 [Musa balbisiana]